MSRWPQLLLSRFLVALTLLAPAGCNPFHRPLKLPERVDLIAVMPIEPAGHTSAIPGEQVETLPPEAPRQVTAAVYGALRIVFRVACGTGSDRHAGARAHEGRRGSRCAARALGKEVGADAVLFGTVSRYVERVGAEYGARRPAAVALTLKLISVRSGGILWTRSIRPDAAAPHFEPVQLVAILAWRSALVHCAGTRPPRRRAPARGILSKRAG